MRQNLHSTLGGGALMHIDKFQLVAPLLDINYHMGDTYTYSTTQLNIRNGLDYIPVLFDSFPIINWIHKFLSLIHQVPTAATTIKWSTRLKRPNTEYSDYICDTSQHVKHDTINSEKS